MRIITSADVQYLPGVIALYNSTLVNASNYKFTCMVHDKETERTLKNLSIPSLFVDRKSLPELPTSRYWKKESMAMYSRLLIPHLFTEEQLLWIDADAIIVKPLPKIKTEKPCGGVITSSLTIKDQVVGILDDKLNNTQAIQAGVLLFNKTIWLKEGILKKCLEIMQMPYEFLYVVQSVLSLALEGNFEELEYKWNTYANRGKISEDTLIAHFVGNKFLPWKNNNIPNIHIWENYYNKGKVL